MDFLRVIRQLDGRELHLAQIAIQGRITLMENRQFLEAAETYLALGCEVSFTELLGVGMYTRREGIVVGYTSTMVRVQFDRPEQESTGLAMKSVPWRELSSCRT